MSVLSCDAHITLNDTFQGGHWLQWAAPSGTSWNDARTRGFWQLYSSIQRHGQPMTSPVLIEVHEGDPRTYRTLFKVADSLRLTAADEDAGVSSVRLPDMLVHTYTMHKFGSYVTEAASRDQAVQLARCSGSMSMPAVWYAAFYDPPYKFWNRHSAVFMPSAEPIADEKSDV